MTEKQKEKLTNEIMILIGDAADTFATWALDHAADLEDREEYDAQFRDQYCDHEEEYEARIREILDEVLAEDE